MTMKNLSKKIKINNGFIVIFSVLISSIFLAISLGVTNIALKEIRFSTSGKDTNDAFFAADVGAECALLYDKSTGITANRFILPDSGASMTCADNSFTPTLSGADPLWSYSFIVTGLGFSGQACSKVTIVKDNRVPPVVTTITSNGFNTGDSLCVSSSQNLVSRQLQVTY